MMSISKTIVKALWPALLLFLLVSCASNPVRQAPPVKRASRQHKVTAKTTESRKQDRQGRQARHKEGGQARHKQGGQVADKEQKNLPAGQTETHVKASGKPNVVILYSKPGERAGRYVAPGRAETLTPGVSNKVRVNQTPTLFSVAPERVRPFVMRVWIAPWRDKNDRLKWARTVYIDLPINKWNVGVKPSITSKERLLEILSTQSSGTVNKKPTRPTSKHRPTNR